MRYIALIIALIVAALPTGSQASSPVLFGAYYHPHEIRSLMAWLEYAESSTTVSIAGDFVGLTTGSNNISRLIEYDAAGLVPFINIMPQDCRLADIALGGCDREIDSLISTYKTFSRPVFLAPFPEANGNWVEYGLQPDAYKAAFRYMRNRFVAAGLTRTQVLWVFAPNGWSQAGHEFERYYPGPDVVDVVGFSAFNHGPQCGGQYQTYEQAILPYLERMAIMAPDKPIFLTQFGSLANKGQWTADVLTKFAAFPNARAAIYFNTVTSECGGADYTITGAPEVVEALGRYENWPAGSWIWFDLFSEPRPQTFADVPATHWAASYIEQIYQAGITGGCGVSPAIYCPDGNVTRAQMAVFLLRVKYGSNYQPPSASGRFVDVPVTHWAAAWIEQLAKDGITGGCAASPARYCPESQVTRAQMAVLLLRVKYGTGYQPVQGVGTFLDVPVSHWAASWVEQAVADGIIQPCGDDLFCPDGYVSRAEMAEYVTEVMP